MPSPQKRVLSLSGYFHKSPQRPLMPRKTVETYPFFSWKISCPAPIMGESSGSKRVCVWTRSHLLALSHNSRTILRRKIAKASDSRIGQIMGECLVTAFRELWAIDLGYRF